MNYSAFNVVARPWLLTPLVFTMTSCRIPEGLLGGSKGKSTVTASHAIDEIDQKLEGLKYMLHCQGLTPVFGKAGDTLNSVIFDDPNLKDGLSCSLDVRIPNGSELAYSWLAKNAAGEPEIGLLYASNASVIASGKLTFNLYKVFARKSEIKENDPCLTGKNDACEIKQKVALGKGKNIFAAHVVGRKGKGYGDTVNLLVGRGAGFEISEIETLTVEELNADLHKQDDLGPPQFAFNAIKDITVKTLEDQPFNQLMQGGTAFLNQRVSREDKRDITIIDIKKVWLHGFHQISAENLSLKKGPTTWLAKVSLGDQSSIVISGRTKYFSSTPVTAGDLLLTKELLSSTNLVKDFRVYAPAGSGVTKDGCSLKWEDILENQGLKNIDTWGSDLRPVEALDQCELSEKELASLDLKSASLPPVYYGWGWHEVTYK